MTFAQGQLTGTDLSPAAGILGTQIADKTLQFRNFSEDTFKIVRSGTATVTVGSGDSYTTKTTTVAHGLGFTPIVLAFIDAQADLFTAGGRVLTPYTMYESTTTSAGTGFLNNQVYVVIAYFTATADNTNLYFNIGTSSTTFYSQLQKSWVFTYYMLQETAN